MHKYCQAFDKFIFRLVYAAGLTRLAKYSKVDSKINANDCITLFFLLKRAAFKVMEVLL